MSKLSKATRRFGAVLALVTLAGCAAMDENVSRMNADVMQMSIGEPYPLSATDLAAALLQAGFTPEEVLDYGPRVRNAIGEAGGAQINERRSARAILSVQDRKLFISSRETGTFIRNL